MVRPKHALQNPIPPRPALNHPLQSSAHPRISTRLSVMIESAYGVTADETIQIAKERKSVIASNNDLSHFLERVSSWRDWHPKLSGLPAWTGTLVIYEAPDKPFGPTIEYVDAGLGAGFAIWAVEIPRQFRGMRNVALVAEHPDYDIEILNGPVGYGIVHSAHFSLIYDFPLESGFYVPEPIHGIPVGKLVSPDNQTRKVRRLQRLDMARIGLISRSCFDADFGAGDRISIDISLRGSARLGAIEFSPETSDSEALTIRHGDSAFTANRVYSGAFPVTRLPPADLPD